MDEVICPYCGEKIRIELCDIGDVDAFIEECPNCEKEVEVSVETVVELSADKPKYFKCEVCGKNKFEIESRQLPYDREDGKWKYKKLCGECYWRELNIRREK